MYIRSRLRFARKSPTAGESGPPARGVKETSHLDVYPKNCGVVWVEGLESLCLGWSRVLGLRGLESSGSIENNALSAQLPPTSFVPKAIGICTTAIEKFCP